MHDRGLFYRAVAAMLLGIQVAGCAGAKVPQGIAPGDRVRASIRQDGAVAGRVVRLSRDTLVLETGGDTIGVARASVQRIDVRTGTHGHGGIGFLVGLAVGGGLGAALLASAGEDCTASDPNYYPGCGDYTVPPELAYAPMVMLGGALLGGIVGAVIRSDTWTEVPISAIEGGKPESGSGSR